MSPKRRTVVFLIDEVVTTKVQVQKSAERRRHRFTFQLLVHPCGFAQLVFVVFITLEKKKLFLWNYLSVVVFVSNNWRQLKILSTFHQTVVAFGAHTKMERVKQFEYFEQRWPSLYMFSTS